MIVHCIVSMYHYSSSYTFHDVYPLSMSNLVINSPNGFNKANASSKSKYDYLLPSPASYSFLTLDLSLLTSVRVWFFNSVENRSFMTFLSARRDCRSAFTACFRSFLSSLDSFFDRVTVTRWTSMTVRHVRRVRKSKTYDDQSHHHPMTKCHFDLAVVSWVRRRGGQSCGQA